MRQFMPLLRVSLPLIGTALILTLLAGFVPGRSAKELRLPLGLDIGMEPHRYAPAPRPLDTSVWMLRRPLHDGKPLAATVEQPIRVDDVIHFNDQGVSLLTAEGPRLLRLDPERSGILQSLQRTGMGLPSGLSMANTALPSGLTAALCIPNPDDPAVLQKRRNLMTWAKGSLSPYRDTVNQYIHRFNLDPYLVYAIMHTESGFDPSAISERFAHGLMQIVPGAAGGEVHAYLYGQPGQPEPSTLLDPAVNIKYGMTYLHLLLRRHMSGVTDSLAREYCAIAAYNTGPTALLKVFGPTREEAFAAINTFSPSELYDVLLKRLPAKETRNFLRKVVMSRTSFALAE